MAKDSLYRDRNLQVIFGVTLTSVMGVSSITPAFPSIIRELGISGAQVGLLLTFFTLPGIILTPLFGVVADRFGRRRLLVPCLFLFGIAGTACAFTRDFDTLLVLRALQGIGWAALGSMRTTIIGDLYSGRQRAEVMGLSTAVLNIALFCYPIVGGALALQGWYYPFLLSIIAIPVGILVLTKLKSPEPRSAGSLHQYLRGIGGHLKNVRLVILFVAAMLVFLIFWGTYLTYFAVHLGEAFDASPLIIGLILSSRSFGSAAVSSQLGRISHRFSL